MRSSLPRVLPWARIPVRVILAVSYFYISRSLQYAPLLQFSLDGLEITLENHIVHDPAIEEALRYNP